MLKSFLVALMVLVAPLSAQIEGSGIVLGVPDTFPVYSVEQLETLGPVVEGNAKAWEDARSCFRLEYHENAPRLRFYESPPPLVLLPARAFFVKDDPLVPSTYIVPFGPVIAYSLLEHDLVVLANRDTTDFTLVRHEYLHHLLWRSKRLVGHPDSIFQYCDGWPVDDSFLLPDR